MTTDSNDSRAGYARPPRQTQWKPGETGNKARKSSKRAETTLEIIDKLLMKPIEITLREKSHNVTTLEAILLRLWQQEVLGDPRALRLRLRYQEFARQHAKPRTETVFVDSDYTTAFAAVPHVKGNNNGGL